VETNISIGQNHFAAAIPREVVPPRINNDCPDWHSKALFRAPHTAWNISGIAAKVGQSRFVSTGKIESTGIRANSAYETGRLDDETVSEALETLRERRDDFLEAVEDDDFGDWW
jgi:hypothetical protein